MNITIRNLGFSIQNHNAGIARKPVQSKPDVFIKNQDKLSFGRIKRVISTADDLINNVREAVTSTKIKDDDLLDESVKRSIGFVQKVLQEQRVKKQITQILQNNKRPDGSADAIADMLNDLANAGIKL